MLHAVSVCCIQRVGARGQSGTQQSSLARVRAAAQGGSVRRGGRRRRKEGTAWQHRREHDRQRGACKDCGVSPSEPLHTCSRVRAIGSFQMTTSDDNPRPRNCAVTTIRSLVPWYANTSGRCRCQNLWQHCAAYILYICMLYIHHTYVYCMYACIYIYQLLDGRACLCLRAYRSYHHGGDRVRVLLGCARPFTGLRSGHSHYRYAHYLLSGWANWFTKQ